MIAGKPLITVAETTLFARQASEVWTGDERAAFIVFIAANPEVGDVIPQTGGLRKMRWRRAGSGKRGGVRVIYYFYDATMPIYLLTLYAKASQPDLSPDEKQRISALVATLKNARRRTAP